MAAVNVSRPRMASERPSTGSWDDLILRNRGRRPREGETAMSENDARRRARSSSGSEDGDLAKNRGAADLVDEYNNLRQQQCMTVHHQSQRTSQAFATHIAAIKEEAHSSSTPVNSSDEMGFDGVYPGAWNYRPATTGVQQTHNQQQRAAQRPRMYSRPQRLSKTSKSVNGPIIASEPGPRNSFDRSRHSQQEGWGVHSWSGTSVSPGTSFDDILDYQTFPMPSLAAKHSGPDWQRRPQDLLRPARLSRPGPNVLFNKLPNEVLQLILDHLRGLHLEPKNSSCATCWMRDCCSVAMCNSKCLHVARGALYENIQLNGPDCVSQIKKYKGLGHSSRLVLLRRTLRGDTRLAELVRSIKVPALPDNAPVEAGAYHDIVASVVMACPKLERLDGFYPVYNHGESRLFNALGSRLKLKEMTWVIDGTPVELDQQAKQTSQPPKPTSRSRQSKQASLASSMSSKQMSNPNSYLTPQLANKFVRQHMNWHELTHLTIHCLPGANLSTPNGLISVTLTYLDSLQSLYLSHLPARSFDDNSLLAIPQQLRKLGLSHCAGITSAGLSTFATHAPSQNLETLTLIHQNVDSITAIVRIFSHLSKLTTFNIVQTIAPMLPEDTLIWLMPYLASASLQNIHWDIFESGPNNDDYSGACSGATQADDILARSIAAKGFPNLRMLRTPCDTDGIFQNLCRPRERVDLLSDRFRNVLVNQASSSAPSRYLPGSSASTARSHSTKPSTSTSASEIVVAGAAGSFEFSDPRTSWDSGKVLLPLQREAGSNLQQARLAAQARLEAARRFPRFEANVIDETGEVIESTGLAGFIGDVGSSITYCLTPDAGGGSDGLVGIAELLGDGGEDTSGRGDAASRSGAGFGTGCVAIAHALEAGGGRLSKASASSTSSTGWASLRSSVSVGGDVTKPTEGCTGRWNSFAGEERTGQSGKKGGGGGASDRWWHTPRGRWRGRVELS